VRKPIVFVWQDDPAAPIDTIYHVTVLDAAERLVAERDTRARRYAASSDMEAVFQPGATFSWQVGTLGPDGKTVRQSAPATFTIK
jgi:hypothetical protein